MKRTHCEKAGGVPSTGGQELCVLRKQGQRGLTLQYFWGIIYLLAQKL